MKIFLNQKNKINLVNEKNNKTYVNILLNEKVNDFSNNIKNDFPSKCYSEIDRINDEFLKFLKKTKKYSYRKEKW